MKTIVRFVVAVLFAVAPSRALAEERASDEAAARPALGQLLTGGDEVSYEEGKALFAREQFSAAAEAFGRVYEHAADARLLWNIAACEKKMRHYAKSLLLVQRYLVSEGERLDDGDRLEAERLIAALRPFTAPISVRSDEPGAEIFVDDVLVGTTPLPLVLVDIGFRQVRARKAGFLEVTDDTFVDGRSPVAVVVVVVRLTKARAEGRLNVSAPSAASVFVDGRAVGSAPWSATVPSGTHVVRVTAPNRIAFEKEILVRGNEVRDVTVSLDADRSTRSRSWVWLAAGAVLTGAAAAGGYWVVSQSQAH